MLEKNAAHPGENAQPRGGGSYEGRRGQITWRIEGRIQRGRRRKHI